MKANDSLRRRFLRLSAWLVVLIIAMQMLIFAGWELFTELSQRDEHWHTLIKDPVELKRLIRENREHAVEEIFLLCGIGAATTPLFILMVFAFSRRLFQPIESIARSLGEDAETEPAAGPKQVSYPHADEIGMLVEALNAAFRQYHESLEKARRFSADASHQLRTPLAVMRTTGELALERERSTEGYREALHTMLEESARLEHVVEQLLLLSTLQDRHLQRRFEPVDLRSVVQQIEDRYALVAESNQVQWSLEVEDPLPRVRGIPLLVAEAIANLVDNALRATPEHGSIQIRVTAGGDTVLVHVQDSGVGIPEAMKARLFERFSRAPDAAYSGSGLGLAIVLAIAELHQAGIQVETPPGGGTRFTLCFAEVK